ncbi:MAG: tRNA (guanosine(37)-N1)-methyltransferase TrmD [Thermoanaerobaculia bacterium]
MAAPAEHARLRIDLVSIFPRMFDPLLAEGVVAKARESGILAIKVWDLRDFTSDRHRSTDDVPYGGGAGMVMLAEPVFRCVDAIRADGPAGKRPLVLLPSPQGEMFRHETARELAAGEWLVLLCGRYEGFDERVREGLVDREISVGDFVVSGGEIPAMLIVDAVARLVEGVVGDWNSVEADSFYTGLLDHPHYTRPAELRDMRVPDVLLSGHAERIRKWRKEQALRATLARRPDLLDRIELDEEGRRMLAAIRGEPAEEPHGRKRRKG